MCLGTFSRRGAFASATIYPCAECASSRSFFIVWKRSFLYDKKTSTENSAKGRLNPNAVPPLFSGKTDLLQRLRRQLFRNLVAVIPLEPLSDNGDYRESLPRSCAFSSPIPKPHSVLLCSGLLSAIRDPLCHPGKRTLLLPHLCPCTMYTIGKN